MTKCLLQDWENLVITLSWMRSGLLIVHIRPRRELPVAKHMKMAAAGYLLDKELKFLNISSQSLCFFFASSTILFATLSSSFLVKSFSF
jgi:hypothetical protein